MPSVFDTLRHPGTVRNRAFGGIGVTEAALIAGLTALGVPPEAAAAVVTYRLFTTYLPPIPGSYATKWLVANGDL